jgi:hypothetical protein
MCDNMPMPKISVFCCQQHCRWIGMRHPYTAYEKPCPRCGGRLIGDEEYRHAVREQYRQFLRENAKAVGRWPEWMRVGARGESIVQSPNGRNAPKP